MAVLWNLVNPGNFDPLGSFTKGADLAKKQQIEQARQSTLAQLVNGGGTPDFQHAISSLAAAGDLQGAQAIGSIYGQQDDRQFRHTTSDRDFALRQNQFEQQQKNADRSYGLQAAQFGLTKEQANKPQIVQIEDPSTGIKKPFIFNPLTRQVEPFAPNAQQPGGMGQPNMGQPAGQPAQNPVVIPPPPPGVDVKEWRKQAAKNAFSQIKGQDQAQTSANIVVQDIDRALDLAKNATIPVAGAGGLGNLASKVPGTNAFDVARLLDTVKANASFDRLQAMRNASPTGGALGQVSDTENKLLQATIGSLEQSQSQEQFVRNLKRVRDVYDRIINGPQAATQSAPVQGGMPQGVPPQLDRSAVEQELRRRGAIQ